MIMKRIQMISLCIDSLPSISITKKGHQDVQYYDAGPIPKIQAMVWAYEDEMRAKERARLRRQEQWNNFKETMNSIFTLDHFKRKPALDLDASLSHDRDEKQVKN